MPESEEFCRDLSGHSEQRTAHEPTSPTFLRATALIWAYFLHHSARSISASSCTPDCHHVQKHFHKTHHDPPCREYEGLFGRLNVFTETVEANPRVAWILNGGHLICLETGSPPKLTRHLATTVSDSGADSHSPWCQPVPASRSSLGSTSPERPGMGPPCPSRYETPP